MIEYKVKTDGNEIMDFYDEENPSLKECALIIYRLEQLKLELLEKQFKNKLEISEGEDEK